MKTTARNVYTFTMSEIGDLCRKELKRRGVITKDDTTKLVTDGQVFEVQTTTITEDEK